MENRITKVRAILTSEKLDGLIVSSNINIRYLTGFDGFGSHEREGYALLTRTSLYIFASPLSAEGARNKTRESNIQVVELTAKKRLIPTLQEIIGPEKLVSIGFEENLTYSEFKTFKKLKGVKLKLAEEIIEEVRIVKDTEELESLKKACELTDAAFNHILNKIKIGMTELGLAWEIEKYIRENGGELAFPTIVAFGSNSAIPHHVTSSQNLEASSCILLDFGAKINGYHADMSRTIFFGKADEKFKKMYEAVRAAQKIAFCHSGTDRAKRGSSPASLKGEDRRGAESIESKEKDPIASLQGDITPEQIDKLARDYIISKGFPNIPHSVGHGVGLQVHEFPHISPGFKEEIQANTAFTIEPGIYINGVGGVRIEDTVYYDGREIIQLTRSRKELIEL